MIDIIIPAYNAHKTIENTLFSISYQENINDINVYIVNDLSGQDYSKEVNFFKNFMKIKELKLKKNSGPGVARQYGIDNSDNPYIVFIDADDAFASPKSISILYDAIIEDDYDVVISNFIEETSDEMIEHMEDNVWLHGKIYKREFIEKNNIKFNDTRANEDNGFNQLIFLHDAKVKKIDDITYFWCFNENSLTRKNNHEYRFLGLEGYLFNLTWALDIAINNNCSYEKISNLALAVLISIYCYYIEFINEKGIEKLLINSKRLKRICCDEYPIKDEKERNLAILEQLKSADNLEEILINPPCSIADFIKKIDEI